MHRREVGGPAQARLSLLKEGIQRQAASLEGFVLAPRFGKGFGGGIIGAAGLRDDSDPVGFGPGDLGLGLPQLRCGGFEEIGRVGRDVAVIFAEEVLPRLDVAARWKLAVKAFV